MRKGIKRVLVIIAGIIFLILGVIGLALPFLQGFLFIAIGLILLSLSSSRLRDWIDTHTRRYPRLNRFIKRMERWILKIVGPVDAPQAKVPSKQHIEHIIFDLGEVLITGIKDTGIALREKHQLEIAGPKMDWATEKHPLLTPLSKEFFHGNVSEDEYVHDVVQKYPSIGEKAWLKEHIRENFREVEGTRDIVLELRKLGYTLALLSNHGKEWVDHTENKFDFHKLFDVRVYSYEIGVSKPHPKSYKSVLDQLKTTSDTCLFIDDSPINVAAAEELGISSILFTTAEDLRAQLRETLTDFE